MRRSLMAIFRMSALLAAFILGGAYTGMHSSPARAESSDARTAEETGPNAAAREALAKTLSESAVLLS